MYLVGPVKRKHCKKKKPFREACVYLTLGININENTVLTSR